MILGPAASGKTTLVHQPGRFIIGDDALAWSDSGLSNLEGGCYARAAHLSRQSSVDIFEAAGRFGSVLENVAYDERTRLPNFEKTQRLENARVTVKLGALPRVYDQSREASPPETIVFLVADEFGALPAVAKLNREQAYRLLVSRARQGSTELVGERLNERIEKSRASLWLLNTGWRVGKVDAFDRYPLGLTRHLLERIQAGDLECVEFKTDAVFGFAVPVSIQGIDQEILEVPTGPQVQTFAAQFFGAAEDLPSDFTADFSESLSDSFSGAFSPARASSASRRRFTSGGI